MQQHQLLLPHHHHFTLQLQCSRLTCWILKISVQLSVRLLSIPAPDWSLHSRILVISLQLFQRPVQVAWKYFKIFIGPSLLYNFSQYKEVFSYDISYCLLFSVECEKSGIQDHRDWTSTTIRSIISK